MGDIKKDSPLQKFVSDIKRPFVSFSSDETKNVIEDLKGKKSSFQNIIANFKNNSQTILNSNYKVNQIFESTIIGLNNYLNDYSQKVDNNFSICISKLEKIVSNMEAINNLNSNVDVPNQHLIIPKDHDNKTNKDQDEDIEEDQFKDYVPLISFVTIGENALLFETLGGDSIKPDLDTKYELIGIFEKDGKYYLKVKDLKTGNIYITEFNSEITIEKELKVLRIKEDVVILNTTDVDNVDDAVNRVAEAGELFIIEEIIENNGISFAKILDDQGNALYISLSDLTEEISLDSLKVESLDG